MLLSKLISTNLLKINKLFNFIEEIAILLNTSRRLTTNPVQTVEFRLSLIVSFVNFCFFRFITTQHQIFDYEI